MGNNDQGFTDYQQGTVISEIAVTKMANGMWKVSGSGCEVNDHDQQKAVLQLQEEIQQKLLSGEIQPDMW